MSSKMLINAELGWSTLRGWSSSAKGWQRGTKGLGPECIHKASGALSHCLRQSSCERRFLKKGRFQSSKKLTKVPGTDVMITIFYDFRQFSAKNWRFWLKTKLNYAKCWSKHWFLRKTPIFFAENCQKSQKIVITSTPD
jgi:hypothetical protein